MQIPTEFHNKIAVCHALRTTIYCGRCTVSVNIKSLDLAFRSGVFFCFRLPYNVWTFHCHYQKWGRETQQCISPFRREVFFWKVCFINHIYVYNLTSVVDISLLSCYHLLHPEEGGGGCSCIEIWYGRAAAAGK